MITLHRFCLCPQLHDWNANANQTCGNHPASLTPKILDFCQALSKAPPEFVPVVQDPHGDHGWCAHGVGKKIRSDGGEHAYGWTIWEWSGVMLTAEFHDVWRSPDGSLVDITPKPDGEERILFVQDSAYGQDFDFLKWPRNRRQRIFTGLAVTVPPDPLPALIDDLIRACEEYQKYFDSLGGMKGGRVNVDDHFLNLQWRREKCEKAMKVELARRRGFA